jgi:diguanylate cyclase (GGDEF)-like protein
MVRENTISPRLLVVAPHGEWPAAHELGSFEVRNIPHLSDVSSLARVDCAVLALERRHALNAAVSLVETARRDTPMAMVLATRANAPVDELLSGHEFDGFIDLAWPARVAGACLRTAIRHAQVDRNVLEIQRAVLKFSRDEAEHLFALAAHDDLTGLYNRRHFLELLAREHERALRHHLAYGVVFVDLDDLKRINERFGHAGGSRVLRELSQTLTSLLRASDVVGRVGGDEFVVLLGECGKSEATLLAERIRCAIEERPIELGGTRFPVSASLGVAAYPVDGHDPTQVLARADRALYLAKERGKNRAVVAG